MTIRSKLAATAVGAVALAGGLAGCASADGVGPGAPYAAPGYAPPPMTGVSAPGRRAAADGVLDELPAHPPAGTCYARVKVINDDPPPGARAVWRLTPGLPGALGPTWCLVLEPGQAPPPPPPERFGWVKVLCDVDATPERVRVIQSRLHSFGDYEGPESGRYDQATADAVARFQRERHIDHGGYLSLQTVEAIERAEVRRAAATGGPIHAPCCAAPPPPPPVQVRVPVPVPVRVEVPVPYPVRVEVPVPQPYPVRVEVRVPQPYPVQVAVPQPYPVYVPAPQPCCVAPPPPCCIAPPPPQPCCQAPGGFGYGPGYGQPPGYGGYAPTPYAPTPYAPTPYAPTPYAPTPYAPTLGRDPGGWLTWPGKTPF